MSDSTPASAAASDPDPAPESAPASSASASASSTSAPASSAAPDIPRFAVVGRQNKGKSSVLATLVEQSDNDKIRIGPTPGETTRCYSVPLQLNGATLIEFIDTPGFSRARQALAWLKEHHPETEGVARLDTVRRFVEAHRRADGGGDFPDECELLTPILDGAGIVYVVDGSKPFRPDFVAEFEILRWTGRPRMAVLNNQSDDSDHSGTWREHLGEAFNLTREFDAHEAQFDERIRLLRHLLEIEDRQQARISKTIDLVEAEWAQRRDEAADTILEFLEAALTAEASKNVGDGDLDRDFQRQRIEDELKESYREKIRDVERDYHRRLVDLSAKQVSSTACCLPCTAPWSRKAFPTGTRKSCGVFDGRWALNCPSSSPMMRTPISRLRRWSSPPRSSSTRKCRTSTRERAEGRRPGSWRGS